MVHVILPSTSEMLHRAATHPAESTARAVTTRCATAVRLRAMITGPTHLTLTSPTIPISLISRCITTIPARRSSSWILRVKTIPSAVPTLITAAQGAPSPMSSPTRHLTTRRSMPTFKLCKIKRGAEKSGWMRTRAVDSPITTTAVFQAPIPIPTI